MQSNRVLVSLYPTENISEKHLRIFYKKSSARKTLLARQRIIKKMNVYTAEQAEIFENIFDIVYTGFIDMLKKQYPSLSTIERIMLGFIYVELPEIKIARNMGFTIEEVRRHKFILCNKMNIQGTLLYETVLSIHL
jgi:hypothetical protein